MKSIPQDIQEAVGLLRVLQRELPDTMGCAFDELFHEFREDVTHWRNGGNEPDWSEYRHEINQICMEDGMPRLCKV